ncbi:Interferon-induced transmembrane protein [Parelusimicrobium proximum]|uniref:CD225/dispanin family protein n=1 Tax=Parelusimicrobium proximum TaxID=3228953 RepID=UPI003D17FE14
MSNEMKAFNELRGGEQKPESAPHPQPAYTGEPFSNGVTLSVVALVVSFLFFTLICPVAIVALVFALRVDDQKNTGRIEEAKKSARLAKILSWITLGITIGFWALMILFFVGIIVLAAIGSAAGA